MNTARTFLQNILATILCVVAMSAFGAPDNEGVSTGPQAERYPNEEILPERVDIERINWEDDYYHITVPEEYLQVSIQLMFFDESDDLDLYLYDASGETVTFSADSGFYNEYEVIDFGVPAGGDYYICVKSAGGSGPLGATYELMWVADEVYDGAPLEEGVSFNGRNWSRDVYKIEVHRGSIEIVLDFVHSDVDDLNLFLYNDEGQLAESISTTDNESIHSPVLEAGTYEIWVKEGKQPMGRSYTLEWDYEQAPSIESVWADYSTVVLPETSTVSVVASDVQGDALTYTWSMVSGPGTATFASADAAVSQVSFDTPGTYTVSVAVSDGVHTTDSEAIAIAFNTSPKIDLNPKSVDVILPPDQQTTVGASLLNIGYSDLTWKVQTGPYQWMDSNDLDGPEYIWEDISTETSAVRLDISNREHGYEEVSLDFDFPFYGETFSSVCVSVDGHLTLGAGDVNFYNYPMPHAGFPNIIAPLWADLDAWSGGDIYVLNHTDRVVVQYENVFVYAHWAPAYKRVTFQAVLKKSGEIYFYYKDMELPRRSTVGIQNGGGTLGLQLAYDEDYVENELAVYIQPAAPWLSIIPSTNGEIPGGEGYDIDLHLNTDGLEGTHQTFVIIDSNDMRHPRQVLPVTLTINNPPTIESVPWAAPDTITLPETSTVSVVASDFDYDVLTYAWSMVSGPGTATFTSPDADVSEVSFDTPGTYTLSVAVFDGTNTVNSEIVTVTVTSDTWSPSKDQWYFIQNIVDELPLRLKHDGTGTPSVVDISDETEACKWQFIEIGDAWFIQNANGDRLQDGNGGNDPEMVPGSTTDERGQWNVEVATLGKYWITSRGTNNQTRLRTDGTTVPDMCKIDSIGHPTRWEFVETTAPGIPPTIAFTSHSNGDLVLASENVTIKIDASDNSGIEKVLVWSRKMPATDWNHRAKFVTEPYQMSLGQLEPGTYDLVAKAYANDGETVVTAITIKVVTRFTEPTITITTPSDGEQISAAEDVIVGIDSSDDSGVDRVFIWTRKIPETEWDYRALTYTGTIQFNLRKYEPGTYDLAAKIQANDGETAITTITFTVVP